MLLCKCGKPTHTGRSGNNATKECLICETARIMKTKPKKKGRTNG